MNHSSRLELIVNLMTVKLRSANWGHSPPSSTPTQPDLPGTEISLAAFIELGCTIQLANSFPSFIIIHKEDSLIFNFGPKRIIRGPLKFLFSEQQSTIVKSKHSKKCVYKIKTFYAFVEALKSCSFHIGSAFATVRISCFSVVCKPHCLKENNRNIVFKSELVSAGHLRHF